MKGEDDVGKEKRKGRIAGRGKDEGGEERKGRGKQRRKGVGRSRG